MACGWPAWTLLLVFSGNFLLSKGNCPSDNPQHTMCLTDVGTAVTISEDMKQKTVDRHNEIRGESALGAANMQKLVWDDKLAEVAGKWARQCSLAHDKSENRAVEEMPEVYTGQNMAFGTADLLAATNLWQSEIVNFTYGENTGKTFGHYTQIIWDVTGRIGCGQADCTGHSSYDKFYVCNYAVGGNFNWEKREWKPYKKGTICSECPEGKCSDNVCDCGGLVCYNGGTININTCSCTCPSLYEGDNCQTKSASCPADWEHCQLNLDHFGKETACGWPNIKEKCPNACGLC